MATNAGSPSVAVVRAVAEAEGVDPTELRMALYDAVEVDALDHLFRDGPGEVTFVFHGYEVAVDHTGKVQVTHAEELPS